MLDLRVWPNQEADGNFPSTTPGKARDHGKEQMQRLAKVCFSLHLPCFNFSLFLSVCCTCVRACVTTAVPVIFWHDFDSEMFPFLTQVYGLIIVSILWMNVGV
jgi:hypothetical protein